MVVRVHGRAERVGRNARRQVAVGRGRQTIARIVVEWVTIEVLILPRVARESVHALVDIAQISAHGRALNLVVVPIDVIDTNVCRSTVLWTVRVLGLFCPNASDDGFRGALVGSAAPAHVDDRH